MIKTLQIENYKSIEVLGLDCARINVFVGEPNVGKSNILEALDLSYLSWMLGINEDYRAIKHSEIDLKKYFRVNRVADLFHLGNISEPIVITHSGYSFGTMLEHEKKDNYNHFRIFSGGSFTNFDNEFKPIETTDYFSSPINPYQYKSEIQFEDVGNHLDRLMPPFGNNLGSVIRFNKDMQELLKDFAEENNFELKINSTTSEIAIQLRVNEGLVYDLPYSALADTYKRMLFYIAAIRHGIGKIITLDEPDTHAFPKYVSYLADEIIAQQSKQFFITTHNPYLLNQLIEKTPAGELAVFVCGYDKSIQSTTAKRLTEIDLGELLDYGVDIFFNLNKYLDDSIEYSA